MSQSDTPRRSGENVHILAGQVWYDKRASWRTVTVTGVFESPVYDRRGELVAIDRYVHVVRNTSRRTQAIKVDTLCRKYRRLRMTE